jgi:hypothetical protein
MYNEKKFDQAVRDLPKLYATERTKTSNKMIAMHLFVGNADWWIAEGDAKEGVLFGFACLGDWQNAEWGYVGINELKEIKVPMDIRFDDGKIHRGFIEVDVDLHWNPCRFKDIKEIKENLF